MAGPFFRDQIILLGASATLLGNLAMGKLSETIISKTVINHSGNLANKTNKNRKKPPVTQLLPNYQKGRSTNMPVTCFIPYMEIKQSISLRDLMRRQR